MRRFFIKLMSASHVFWYRLSGGALGGKMMGAPILLLTTIGRKTGKARTAPLMYISDGDDLVVVASNAGSDNAPAWWGNLQKEPHAEVQVRGEKRKVVARQATPEEKSRLWPPLTAMYPSYDDYQKKTTREIPVVILRRDG